VWLGLAGFGLLVINANGEHRVIKSGEDFIFTEVNNQLLYTTCYNHSNLGTHWMKVMQWQNDNFIFIDRLPQMLCLNTQERGIWKLRKDGLIYNYKGTFYYIRNNKVIWELPAKILTYKVYEIPTGEILVSSYRGQKSGLWYYASFDHFRRNDGKNLLPGQFVTNVLVDREGGWWVMTLNAGIFYCSNPKLDIFDITSGLSSNDILRLANDGKETVFAGLRPAGICTINRLDGNAKRLPIPKFPIGKFDIWTVFYDTLHRKLFISNPLLYFNKNKWETVTWLYNSNVTKAEIPAKKITLDPSGNALWISAPYNFFKFDLNKNIATRNIEKPIDNPRTFSVNADNQNSIWVTTINGLRLWRNGNYELPDFDHPALKLNPRDMEILPNGGLAIGLFGGGLLIRDNKGRFVHLTQREGLLSDQTTKLHVTQDGFIYACSNAGLAKVNYSEEGKWKIEKINIKDGLPSNQVNDATVLAGELWVATNKGLARFRSVPKEFPMTAPIMDKLRVNDRELTFKQNYLFAPIQNNVAIQFFSLNFRSEGEINYRYRLLGADTTFNYTDNRSVNFASLAPGHYTFEVQAQNESGIWSEPSRWSFEIGIFWYQTFWFWSLMTAFIIRIIVLWYRNRLIKAHKDLEVRNKIRDLEAEALRAQMNPHFIFNCLGSIQQYITQHDSASASKYLSNFARLVRLALHGSVDGRHSLQDEIDMLENYLGLERLRFGEKFTFKIEIDPGLDKANIFFPPLLIQPFVENALVHGISNKMKDGKINISFTQKGDKLHVKVCDNGPGVSTVERALNVSGHKSVGMTLTKHRLEILSQKDSFFMKPVIGPDGKAEGTEVEIVIPIA
jgi:hypothetical protein